MNFLNDKFDFVDYWSDKTIFSNKNKPGLLYKLTNEIKNLGLQTQYASVSTFGNRVVDVFYVKDIFGMKVDSKKRENLIKEKINSIL